MGVGSRVRPAPCQIPFIQKGGHLTQFPCLKSEADNSVSFLLAPT